jgi:HK97 family phage portal protein
MGLIERAIQTFGGLTTADLEQNRVRRSASAPTEQKQIPSLLGGSSLDFGRVWLGGQLDLDELTRWTAYAYSVYAYAAMNYRATKIAEPYLWIGEETDEGIEYLADDPIQQVLDYPSPDFDMGFLRSMTSMYLDMDGEALWHLVRDNGGRIARIYPYAKEQFEVQSGFFDDSARLYARFRIQHQSGPKIYGPEDVVYFREPSIELTGTVTSRLDAALRWANMGERVEESVKQAFKRGVMPFAVFSHPPEYNPDVETREANREALETRYGGAENHGRPLMLYGGLSAQFANVDLSTLLPSEVLDRVEANVALAFGVRAEVLGFMVGLKNSPWSHMETARRITYEDTIEPYWRREEKALTRQLLTPQDRAAGKLIKVDTSEIRALQDDEKLKADIAKQNADIWTVGERRLYTGKEPFGDERDDEVAVARRNPFEPTEQLGRVPASIQRKANETANGNAVWVEFDSKARAQEREWARVVARMLNSQNREVQALAERLLKEVGGVIDATSAAQFIAAVETFLAGDARLRAATQVGPVIADTANDAARRLMGRLGLSFDVVQDQLDGYIQREILFLIDKMGQTTGQAVAKTVQRALEDRVPMIELRRNLETLPAFDRARAQLVARTETTRAANGAQLEVAREYQSQTGRVMQKRWLSSQDDRTRDEHLEYDAIGWVELDYFYDNDLDKPGEPNCRCTMLYQAVEAQP